MRNALCQLRSPGLSWACYFLQCLFSFVLFKQPSNEKLERLHSPLWPLRSPERQVGLWNLQSGGGSDHDSGKRKGHWDQRKQLCEMRSRKEMLLWAPGHTFNKTSCLLASFLQLLQEIKFSIFPLDAIRKTSQLKQSEHKFGEFFIWWNGFLWVGHWICFKSLRELGILITDQLYGGWKGGSELCESRLMPWAEELLLCFLFGILRGYCIIGCGKGGPKFSSPKLNLKGNIELSWGST